MRTRAQPGRDALRQFRLKSRVLPQSVQAPGKKQERKFNKTKGRRKGPGLKACVGNFGIQWPEGHCSLRKYKNMPACFSPSGPVGTEKKRINCRHALSL
jgi:hypothetical protein